MAQSSDAGVSIEGSGSGLIVPVVVGSSSRGFVSLGDALPGDGSLDPTVLDPCSLGLVSVGGAFAGVGSLGLAVPDSVSRGPEFLDPTLFDGGSAGFEADGLGDGVPLLTF